MTTSDQSHVSKDIAIRYIEIQWKDIHHSRQQTWQALIIVGGVLAALASTADPEDKLLLSLLGVALSLLGAWISWNHYSIMLDKIGVISGLEKKLDLGINYPTRKKLLPVQIIIALVFCGVASGFSGGVVTFQQQINEALHPVFMNVFLPVYVGAGVFTLLTGIILYLRWQTVRQKDETFSHPFYAEMESLEACLTQLDTKPLKLIVGETLDQPGVHETKWQEKPTKWGWSEQNGLITKPVLTTQKDIFQLSLANQTSRQDWHRHKSAVEIFASDKPMKLVFEKPDSEEEREELNVEKGIFIIPPGIWHEVTLEGTTFVFQASLTGDRISSDKETVV